MARSLRHARSRRAVDRSVTQRSTSHGSAASCDASQKSRVAAPPQQEPPKKRGRKPGSQTKLRQPLAIGRVALKPSGDLQFSYVNFKLPYKYTSQLGAILKREYPGLVEDKDEAGVRIGRPRPALDWGDYFLPLPNELGVTNGDRVLSEFWRLFQVAAEDQDEAELEYEQYMDAKVKWCTDEVWPELCRYWCSPEFKEKRKRGQDSRLGSEDIAQNHGGSRPFTETQQVLVCTCIFFNVTFANITHHASFCSCFISTIYFLLQQVMFEPDKATPINTYAVMKSGMKSVDSNGSSGAIRSNKAQKLMDDYIVGVQRVARPEENDDIEEEEQQHQDEQHLNEQVLFDVSGSSRTHGRLAIAHGAVRTVDVRAAAKERSVQPSSSMSMQNMARQMTHLRRENARLEQENCEKDSVLQHTELILGLYRDLGKEIPEQALQRLLDAQAIATGSSHAVSESANNGIHGGQNNEDQDVANQDCSNHNSGNHAST